LCPAEEFEEAEEGELDDEDEDLEEDEEAPGGKSERGSPLSLFL
jgi:hypothetical protein